MRGLDSVGPVVEHARAIVAEHRERGGELPPPDFARARIRDPASREPPVNGHVPQHAIPVAQDVVSRGPIIGGGQRAFVLEPLLEIEPGLILPDGTSVNSLQKK